MSIIGFKFSLLVSAAYVEKADNNGELKGGFKFIDTKTNKNGGGYFMLSATSGASAAIKSLEAKIGAVDAQRAGRGAMQNRLESSIRNQSNVSFNQADARSRIRDADFAKESSNLTQQNIIQQATTSMLMQTNIRNQLALSMFG